MECDYLNGWIKKRSHTQKSHPKVVNPRDIAGERKKKKKKKSMGLISYSDCFVTVMSLHTHQLKLQKLDLLLHVIPGKHLVLVIVVVIELTQAQHTSSRAFVHCCAVIVFHLTTLQSVSNIRGCHLSPTVLGTNAFIGLNMTGIPCQGHSHTVLFSLEEKRFFASQSRDPSMTSDIL